MSIPANISVFIYIVILLIGAFTSTIYIIKSIVEKHSLYKAISIFTSAFLLYSSFEFLLFYFAGNPKTVGLFHICIAISDICYFFMVVSWLFLLGVLSGNSILVKKKILISITAIYGVLVEILVAIHWRLPNGILNFSSLPLNIIQFIVILNFTYSLSLFFWGIRCLLFGVTKMRDRKMQKFMITFSLVFIIYLIWITYWDYSVAYHDASNILKFDPILIIFFISCLISLRLFYKRDLLLPSSKVSAKDQIIDEETLWGILVKKYQLTQRESEIMRLVYQGLSNPDIGKSLFIAEDTVKKHINHIFKKTVTKNRYELLSTITKELK